MRLRPAWRELRRVRFPELPLDCGNVSNPGVVYTEDLLGWDRKATTRDQRRIEWYVDRFDLRDKRLLHIGIGNSGLAQRLCKRAKEIVGTTIDPAEIELAQALALPNYSVVLHNKYCGDHSGLQGSFDFIIENNPTSFCCCITHLAALLEYSADKLGDEGQLVTDQEGLRWVADTSHPRWSFDFDDIAAVGGVVGLSAFRMNRNIYVLSRGKRPAADPASFARHLGRRAIDFSMRVVRLASRWAGADTPR